MNLLAWFKEHRASAHVAFALRASVMAANGLLSLVWTPLLLRGLGAEKYGAFMALQSFLALAAAGELGFGGALGIKTNQLIAAGNTDGLHALHATARSVFLALTLLGTGLLLALAPWLPDWLGFRDETSGGSMTLAFAVGALQVGTTIFASYLGNSIYAAGNVAWPILPGFLIAQITLVLSVVQAWLQRPVWELQGVASGMAVVSLAISWRLYRHSHPVFGRHLPWRFERSMFGHLMQTSFWSYLFGLSWIVYSATDRLVVNAWFGAAAVPGYQLNYKLCELAFALVVTAGMVAMPKIVNALLGSDPEQRARGPAQVARLAQIQGFLGLAACFGYLWGNDLFIKTLFGPAFLPPRALEAGFALSLLLMANGDIFTQLCGRLHAAGLRWGAIVLLSAATLNVVLSIVAAAWYRWLPGVAWATCFAQLSSLLIMGEYVRRRDRMGSWHRLWWRSLGAPLLFLAMAWLVKTWIAPTAWPAYVSLALLLGLLLAVYSQIVGPSWSNLMQELATVRRAFASRFRHA